MSEIGGQPNRIEKNTKIKGDIISEADFRIDGKLDGNVKTSGKVVIGKGGYIHGKVECVNADIEGSFNGELLVSELLSLKDYILLDGLYGKIEPRWNPFLIVVYGLFYQLAGQFP